MGSQSLVVKEGSDITLECSCVGFPLTDNLKWNLPNPTVFQNDIITTRNVTTLVSNIHIQNISRQFAGLYECRFRNLTSITTLQVLGNSQFYFALERLIALTKFLMDYLGAPKVSAFEVFVIGMSKIYVDWIILDGGTDITKLTLLVNMSACFLNSDMFQSLDWQLQTESDVGSKEV